ncbi:hypothetical protein AVEN_101529-1 [Araneus ventricosus]|uniref:RNase H type-1 domain-containing protein n=1 Tax=Araneus ventricosus TaxID=182803 RepID=A0A4Y2GTZ8_ARAVE|nr:hypothetical protein AVEN_101529-1 [Araneus ventricosus]
MDNSVLDAALYRETADDIAFCPSMWTDLRKPYLMLLSPFKWILLNHELNDVKIVSDSRSALMTVESLSDNREFTWQIKKRLKDREDIKLMWVRAHKGEMGKERADLLDKEASN